MMPEAFRRLRAIWVAGFHVHSWRACVRTNSLKFALLIPLPWVAISNQEGNILYECAVNGHRVAKAPRMHATLEDGEGFKALRIDVPTGDVSVAMECGTK